MHYFKQMGIYGAKLRLDMTAPCGEDVRFCRHSEVHLLTCCVSWRGGDENFCRFARCWIGRWYEAITDLGGVRVPPPHNIMSAFSCFVCCFICSNRFPIKSEDGRNSLLLHCFQEEESKKNVPTGMQNGDGEHNYCSRAKDFAFSRAGAPCSLLLTGVRCIAGIYGEGIYDAVIFRKTIHSGRARGHGTSL